MRIDEFVRSIAESVSEDGRYRVGDAYRSVLRRVFLFNSSVHPGLDTVFASRFLRDFQQHLLEDNLSHNTVSFYMSTLRSIYGLAVDRGELPLNSGLFACVFTGSVPTVKRAVSSEIVARLHAADLSANRRLERCRDLFMLCLCFQGMPLIDVLHLRQGDLVGNRLTYFRRKTGTLICVSVLEEAFEYLARLVDPASKTCYLLPYITLSGEEGDRQYKAALHRHNRQLKKLAERLGITENLTSYVARHTWATTAYHNGVEVPVVSQAMGHCTPGMTQTYLDTFSADCLQAANQVVIDAILRPIREGRVTDVREEVRQRVLEAEARQPEKPALLVRNTTKSKPGIPAKSKGKYFNQSQRQQVGKKQERWKQKMSLF